MTDRTSSAVDHPPPLGLWGIDVAFHHPQCIQIARCILLGSIILSLLPSAVSAEQITLEGEFRYDYIEDYPYPAAEYGVPVTKNVVRLSYDPEGGPVKGEAHFYWDGTAQFGYDKGKHCINKWDFTLEGTYYPTTKNMSGKGSYHHYGENCWGITWDETVPVEVWGASVEEYKNDLRGCLIWCYYLNLTPESRITGRAFLFDEKYRYPYGAIRHAQVTLEHKGKIYTTVTDEGGFYEFSLPSAKGDSVNVILALQDNRSNTSYLSVNDGASSTNGPVLLERSYTFTTADNRQEGEINFYFTKGTNPSGYHTSSSPAVLNGLVKEYLIYEDAIDFALSELKTLNYSGTVSVGGSQTASKCQTAPACYERSTRTIYLNETYLKFWPELDSFYATPYTEFHEFGHHVQHTKFDPLPHDNHAGMNNPTTSDSLVEGEAEFLALLMMKYKDIDVIGNQTFGGPRQYTRTSGMLRGLNFDQNYKVWFMEGALNREEYAVASLLWDLHDGTKDRLDDATFPSLQPRLDVVQLTLKDLWSVLYDYRTPTVANLYIGLIRKFPSQKGAIDDLFISHGFFSDADPGDGSYNHSDSYDGITPDGQYHSIYFNGEPFVDNITVNGVRDSTESFVDLGSGHTYPGGQVYTEGVDEIGSAGTSQRPRRTWFKNEASHILVQNGSIEGFAIRVAFDPPYDLLTYEYLTWPFNGLLYIPAPPPEYPMTMTITPLDQAGNEGTPLTLSTTQYYDRIQKATGLSHFLTSSFSGEVLPAPSLPLPVPSPSLPPIPSHGISSQGSLTFESRSATQGSTIQIPLMLRGTGERIGNMDLILTYDPSILEVTEVLPGSLTGTSLLDSNIEKDRIRIGIISTGGFGGEGSVAEIRFTVRGAPGSTSPLVIGELTANRAEDLQELALPLTNGTFTVTAITQGGGSIGEGGASGERTFTALDALIALQMAVGKRVNDFSYDMNEDRAITSLDASMILKRAVE